MGKELIGVHPFETLQVKGGASVDFGGDRLVVLDKANSDFSGEMINIDLSNQAWLGYLEYLPEGGRLHRSGETHFDSLALDSHQVSFDSLTVSTDLTLQGADVKVLGDLAVGNLTASDGSLNVGASLAVDQKLSVTGTAMTVQDAVTAGGAVSIDAGGSLAAESLEAPSVSVSNGTLTLDTLVTSLLNLDNDSTLKALDAQVDEATVVDSTIVTENADITNDLSLESSSRLTVPDMSTDPVKVYKLALDVGGELFVDSTSMIDLDGKGWGKSNNHGPHGRSSCHGGSHSETTGCEKGRYAQAQWAGGGDYTNMGGGFGELNAGNMLVNGVIRANGRYSGSSDEGGAGGGLHLQTPLLSGTGSIEANGRKGRYSSYRSGGGGRISLDVADRSGFIGTFSAAGGRYDDTTQVAGAGTVWPLDTSDAAADTLAVSLARSRSISRSHLPSTLLR